jgi:hypothetical protein
MLRKSLTIIIFITLIFSTSVFSQTSRTTGMGGLTYSIIDGDQSLTFDQTPIDFNVASQTEINNYLFSREIKSKPNKWLFSFNMSKSLFKGAEVSFYVNNFFDDPAIRRYYNTPTDEIDEKRNPDLFYGIELSMMFDSLIK